MQELFRSRGVGDHSDMGVAMQLSGKTLGIIGMGANGKPPAQMHPYLLGKISARKDS